ncbi:hypothetical protein AC578_254 [Pseudocercospora eumusae]|uniref:Uncharacterized protein n=1 Tax=Pseudocercospora eumusae TaxID=321146 RepID=A0A139HIY0_9PEZI|nr:hypothetical protein AC578_254 [Pseudocercospora eumusae]
MVVHYAKINEAAIYTKDSTRAANIPEEGKCEYRNLKPRGALTYKPQIPGAPILEVQTKIRRRFMDRNTMLVRVACPTTRDLDCYELEKVGSITFKILIEQISLSTIEKEENRLLRVQAHKANSERNRVPEYSMVMGNWGTKSKPQEAIKTNDHGVPFADQTRGLIVCQKHSKKKLGHKGV